MNIVLEIYIETELNKIINLIKNRAERYQINERYSPYGLRW